MKILLFLLLFLVLLNLKRIFVTMIVVLGVLFLQIRLFCNFIYCCIFNKKSEIEEINDIFYNAQAEVNIETCFLLYLKEYKEKLDNCIFNEYLLNDLMLSYEKHKDDIENNPNFWNSDNKVNKVAVKQMLVSVIANGAAAKLETGQFHIYRGVLDNTGKELLKIYDFFMNEMLNLNMFDEDTKKPIDKKWIEQNRKILLQNVRGVG